VRGSAGRAGIEYVPASFLQRGYELVKRLVKLSRCRFAARPDGGFPLGDCQRQVKGLGQVICRAGKLCMNAPAAGGLSAISSSRVDRTSPAVPQWEPLPRRAALGSGVVASEHY